MTLNIQEDYFKTESDILHEIEAAGYHPVTIDFPPEKNEAHWHDFDSMVFILDGKVSLFDEETGEQCTVGAGTKLTAPAGVLHHEETEGYKAIVALSVKPEEMTQPVNKPPPVSQA